MFLGPVQPLATPPSVFSLRFNHIFCAVLNSPVAHGNRIQMFVYRTFFGPQSVFCADVPSFNACVGREGPPCVCVDTFPSCFDQKQHIFACVGKIKRKQKRVFFHVLLPESTNESQHSKWLFCCVLLLVLLPEYLCPTPHWLAHPLSQQSSSSCGQQSALRETLCELVLLFGSTA